MSPYIAILFAYSLILACFCALLIAVFFVHAIRELRLRKREQLARPQVFAKGSLQHILIYLHSPLQEMTVWNEYDAAGDTASSQGTQKIVFDPAILALRYEQTTVYTNGYVGKVTSEPPIH